MRLSIVIPCYNEAENLPFILDRICHAISDSNNVEIILIDNGSTDDTKVILQRELSKPENKFVRSVGIARNIGYGHGIMTGIRECRGDVIAWTHADLQTDIEDVFKGYKLFAAQKNLQEVFLKGCRKKRKTIDTILTSGMSVIASLALGRWLSEINAQPKMFHRKFLDLIQNPPDDFSLDLYVLYLAKKKGMKIIELPVYFKERLYGEAKGGGGSNLKTKIKVIKRTLAFIFRLRREIIYGNG